MPLKVIRKFEEPGTAGDGGNVGKEKYLECIFGIPYLVPYVLPGKILIKRIVALSDVDQTCSVLGIKDDLSELDILPATVYITDIKETFALNIYQDDKITLVSYDADPENLFKVTITYQDFNI